jgi:hypothetical protein
MMSATKLRDLAVWMSQMEPAAVTEQRVHVTINVKTVHVYLESPISAIVKTIISAQTMPAIQQALRPI